MIRHLMFLLILIWSSNASAEHSFTVHIPTRTDNLMVGYTYFVSDYFVETNVGIDIRGTFASDPDYSSNAVNVQLYGTLGFITTFYDLQVLYGLGMFYNRSEVYVNQPEGTQVNDYWGGVLDSDIRKNFENYFLNAKIRIHAFNTFEGIDFQYGTSVTPFFGIGTYF
ncbi:MAG: hypothetical protein OCD01_09860 [Fibrobacterales bacterium]